MWIEATPSSWAAVVIGVMVGVYWLRVMQLVWRTKKTAGRAANLVPPELLGRVLRLIWGPVVVLWIFLPMLMPFVRGLPVGLRPVVFAGSEVVGWIAAAVVAAAFAVTWVCWVRMGTSWRMGIDPNEKTNLILTGPYAYVRHPIYGLSQVMMVATFCAWPSAVMGVVAILHLCLMQWEVRREDRYLVMLHGPVYGEYVKRVGRFVPRFSRWK